jgi:C4-dicarboxylate transporter
VDNCTTQYANGQTNTGCIDHAVHTHGGLPVTGFPLAMVVILALMILFVGLLLAWANRPG